MNVCRFFLVASFITFLTACDNDKPGKNGVLSINKMKEVTWDIMQVDEYAGTFLAKDSTVNIPDTSGILYQKVFSLHQVSGKDFYNSFNFYRNHPSYFKILLDSMSAYGNRERDSGFQKSRQVPRMHQR